MNTLTIVVIVLFLIFMVLGCKRGLFRSVFKILLTGLSFILAYFCAPMVSTFLINSTMIDDYINTRISAFIEDKIEEKATEQVKEKLGYEDSEAVKQIVDTIMSNELTRNEQVELIYDMQLPDFLTNALMENNNEGFKNSLGVTAFFEYISSYITYMIMNAMSFVIISFVLWIISNLLFLAIAFVVSLPIVSSINRVGGLIFGAGEALLIVWIAFICITIFSHTEIGAELYSQIVESPILSFIYEHNIFMSIVTEISTNIKIR